MPHYDVIDRFFQPRRIARSLNLKCSKSSLSCDKDRIEIVVGSFVVEAECFYF